VDTALAAKAGRTDLVAGSHISITTSGSSDDITIAAISLVEDVQAGSGISISATNGTRTVTALN